MATIGFVMAAWSQSRKCEESSRYFEISPTGLSEVSGTHVARVLWQTPLVLRNNPSLSRFELAPLGAAGSLDIPYTVVKVERCSRSSSRRAMSSSTGDRTSIHLTHRLAQRDDLDALRALMDASISELQTPFLDARQIASSRAIMGLDTQLVDDGTYFAVEADGEIVGCGGWSRRATLYGGDQSPGRSAALLDSARDAARVRAMYTHPRHTRKGIGRLILSLCEDAARAEGFTTVELMATLAGEPVRASRWSACESGSSRTAPGIPHWPPPPAR